MADWTSKLITRGKEVPRIEIRGITQGTMLYRDRFIDTFAQILAVVFEDKVRLSMNGTASFTLDELTELHRQIGQAFIDLKEIE